jgi:hypothetical protein
MAKNHPTVAALLHDGQWTREAEEEFLRTADKV